uniref:DDE Tnp4 domain-containing protein n=1 Tax=Phytophthora ramorum TaxID=164328 RepID=H3GBV6_PHYRM
MGGPHLIRYAWPHYTNRPTGSMAEVMPFYSANHKLYGLKVEVSVNPRGFAINCSDHARGNTPDITMFRDNTEFHDAIRLRCESDRNLADGGPLKDTFAGE